MSMRETYFEEKSALSILELLGTDAIEVYKGYDLTLSKIIMLREDVPGVCFVTKLQDENIDMISKKKSSFIIAPNSPVKDLLQIDPSCWVVFVANPRLSFIKVITKLLNKTMPCGIDPSAKINPNAKIGAGTYIAPFCNIGDVVIGENCFIDAGTNIKDHVKIGNNVRIGSSTTIGGEGFGFELDEQTGRYMTFPHMAGVTIGDHVHIGSSTAIDRGVLSDTVIEKNCRIDNLVHIAHNVVVEERSVIIAHVMIGGSTRIGKNCWISPGAKILNGIKIANDVTIGMGAVVMKDVPAHSTYVGAPARPIKEHKKMLNFIQSNIALKSES